MEENPSFPTPFSLVHMLRFFLKKEDCIQYAYRGACHMIAPMMQSVHDA